MMTPLRKVVATSGSFLIACALGACAQTPTQAASQAAENTPRNANQAMEKDSASPGTIASDTDENGFVPLFDGTSLAGWHLYRKPGEPVTGWEARDGVLSRVAANGDLMSDGDYGDFDLRFEWKISEGGNSGVFYRATEDEEAAYWTGIEYQVLDNDRHPDGKNGPDRHAAAVYGMYPPQGARTVPVGDWNQARIVVKGAHVEHWLNGVKVAEYTLGTPEWTARVAQTKFKDWPRYGTAARGHIGLQDHGDAVSYRNIRIKAL